MAKKSRTSAAVKNRYAAKHYDRIIVNVPKGRQQTLEEATAIAKQKGLLGEKNQVSGFVNMVLREYLGYTEDEWKFKESSPEESAPAPIDAVPDVEAPEDGEAVEADLPVQDVQDVEAVDVESVPEEVEAPVSDADVDKYAMMRAYYIDTIPAHDTPYELVTLHLNKGKRETLQDKAEGEGISISELAIKAARAFQTEMDWPPMFLETFDYTDETRLAGDKAVEAASGQDAEGSNKWMDAVTVWMPYIPLGIKRNYGFDSREIEHTIISAMEIYIGDYGLEYRR